MLIYEYVGSNNNRELLGLHANKIQLFFASRSHSGIAFSN